MTVQGRFLADDSLEPLHPFPDDQALLQRIVYPASRIILAAYTLERFTMPCRNQLEYSLPAVGLRDDKMELACSDREGHNAIAASVR